MECLTGYWKKEWKLCAAQKYYIANTAFRFIYDTLFSVCLYSAFLFTLALRFFACLFRNIVFLMYYIKVFTPFFFNALCQFILLVNLSCLIFGLTPFGWFICIYLRIFMGVLLFTPTVSGKKLGHKAETWRRLSSLLFSCSRLVNVLCTF